VIFSGEFVISFSNNLNSGILRDTKDGVVIDVFLGGGAEEGDECWFVVLLLRLL
jgi:hypothetical protein